MPLAVEVPIIANVKVTNELRIEPDDEVTVLFDLLNKNISYDLRIESINLNLKATMPTGRIFPGAITSVTAKVNAKDIRVSSRFSVDGGKQYVDVPGDNKPLLLPKKTGYKCQFQLVTFSTPKVGPETVYPSHGDIEVRASWAAVFENDVGTAEILAMVIEKD